MVTAGARENPTGVPQLEEPPTVHAETAGGRKAQEKGTPVETGQTAAREAITSEVNGSTAATEATAAAAAETPAEKTRTRKAPAPRAPKRRAPGPTAEPEDTPATGARRSSRTNKQTVGGTGTEGDTENVSEQEPMGDGSEQEDGDGGEYQEEEQRPAKRAKIRATKVKAAPRKPRPPRKPKEPGERGRGRRAKSPTDAENKTIEESTVKMKDLCRDPLIGKKSKRGKELESTDWSEVVRRQRAYKADLAARRARGEVVDETAEQRIARLAEESTSAQVTMLAPQMRVVDGQIVIDEESLRVDRHQRDALQEESMEVVEENVHTRLVNSGTWSRREKGDKWEDQSTERFYEALSMFGTDFEIISKLFPGRTRRQIKNKFNCEERKDPQRITLALKHRVQAGELPPRPQKVACRKTADMCRHGPLLGACWTAVSRSSRAGGRAAATTR